MEKMAALLVAACALSAAPAISQDFSRSPSFGTVTLSAGFAPDPHDVRVTAGGALDASTLGSGCVGSVANAPDVRLNYTAGNALPLIISVSSEYDTTLAINRPDGSWICNDDADGVNPKIRFEPAMSGQYDIYVGHYERSRRLPATLHISEVER